MNNPFTKHPKETVGETWWEHCMFSCGIGIRLLLTSMYFLVHGIFPFWFEFTASDGIKKLNECMQDRKP